MATFPMFGGQRIETTAVDAATSFGTTTSSGGSANTKSSSWTQIIASTAFDASQIMIIFSLSASATDQLVDIAIGGAGSEVVILSNLSVSTGTGTVVYGTFYSFPISIPAGSRLSVKNQATGVSSAMRVIALLFAHALQSPVALGLVTTYGAATADSGGVSVDPGGSAHTKGSYSEITSSTTYPIRYLSLAIGNQTNNVRTACWWLVDIAIGAGGSEQVIVPNLFFQCNTTPDTVLPQVVNLIPVNIPAGTRIAVRAQSDITDATDRLFDAIIYGAS